MQGAGSLSPGHRRTRIGLWNPYVTLCHPPPGDCFRLSASGIPEQPLGITSDYIEFPLHPPWVSVVFQVDFHVNPCTSLLIRVWFLRDSLVVSFMRSIHVYIHIYICAGCGVPVPRAPQDQDRLCGTLTSPYVTLHRVTVFA